MRHLAPHYFATSRRGGGGGGVKPGDVGVTAKRVSDHQCLSSIFMETTPVVSVYWQASEVLIENYNDMMHV